MEVREFIQRIQSLYSHGVPSDDTRLSNRHIYNKMLTVRSKLISDSAKKKQKISQWNYQVIPCLELIKISRQECPCLPPIGCEILRSKEVLPRPLIGLSSDLITQVTTVDRSIKIDEISINAVNFQKGNKYTSKKLNYFIQGGYLYVITHVNLKAVSVMGLFEDPIAVNYYKGICDCTDCDECIDYLGFEFPIDGSMTDTLIELCYNELVILFSQSIQDLTNNSNDVVKGQNK